MGWVRMDHERVKSRGLLDTAEEQRKVKAKSLVLNSTGIFIMDAGCLIRLSSPQPLFHFAANGPTEVEHACHAFLSPVADISYVTATITTLIRIHLFSQQCNKRTERHRQSVATTTSILCEKVDSNTNHISVRLFEHLFRRKFNRVGFACLCEKHRSKDFAITFSICSSVMVSAKAVTVLYPALICVCCELNLQVMSGK